PTLDMIAVSPDGRWLAVRGSAGLQVHDTADGRLVLECPHITYGYGLAFTPDGTMLAATRTSRPSGIEFWSVPGWRALKPWTSSVEPLKALAFSRDGRLAASPAGPEADGSSVRLLVRTAGQSLTGHHARPSAPGAGRLVALPSLPVLPRRQDGPR